MNPLRQRSAMSSGKRSFPGKACSVIGCSCSKESPGNSGRRTCSASTRCDIAAIVDCQRPMSAIQSPAWSALRETNNRVRALSISAGEKEEGRKRVSRLTMPSRVSCVSIHVCGCLGAAIRASSSCILAGARIFFRSPFTSSTRPPASVAVSCQLRIMMRSPGQIHVGRSRRNWASRFWPGSMSLPAAKTSLAGPWPVP